MFLNTLSFNLDEFAQNQQIQPRPEDVIRRQLSERGRVDGFAWFDARGAAVGGDDGDHFGLFEGLEGGFAVVGFEDVGEEELVVAEGGLAVRGGGERFHEEPSLGWGPFAGWRGVEDVHF